MIPRQATVFFAWLFSLFVVFYFFVFCFVSLRSLKINCPSRFVLNAERGNPQHLRITLFKSKHLGHPTDDQEFAKFIPENRRVTDPGQLQEIEKMIDARGQPMAIRENLRNATGKAVTEKDLQNLK